MENLSASELELVGGGVSFVEAAVAELGAIVKTNLTASNLLGLVFSPQSTLAGYLLKGAAASALYTGIGLSKGYPLSLEGLFSAISRVYQA